MKTYAAIKAEIAKLEKQAESLRKAEVAGVVAKIKEAIAAYALTATDLGLGRGAAKALGLAKSKPGRKSGVTVGVPKYRDPKSGKTWTGRGKPPAWIVGVKSRDAFLIETQSETDKNAPTKRAASPAPKGRLTAKKTVKAKSGKGKARAGRKVAPAPVKTPAVQIESGAAA